MSYLLTRYAGPGAGAGVRGHGDEALSAGGRGDALWVPPLQAARGSPPCPSASLLPLAPLPFAAGSRSRCSASCCARRGSAASSSPWSSQRAAARAARATAPATRARRCSSPRSVRAHARRCRAPRVAAHGAARPPLSPPLSWCAMIRAVRGSRARSPARPTAGAHTPTPCHARRRLLQDADRDARLCVAVPLHHDGAQPLLHHAADAGAGGRGRGGMHERAPRRALGREHPLPPGAGRGGDRRASPWPMPASGCMHTPAPVCIAQPLLPRRCAPHAPPPPHPLPAPSPPTPRRRRHGCRPRRLRRRPAATASSGAASQRASCRRSWRSCSRRASGAPQGIGRRRRPRPRPRKRARAPRGGARATSPLAA